MHVKSLHVPASNTDRRHFLLSVFIRQLILSPYLSSLLSVLPLTPDHRHNTTRKVAAIAEAQSAVDAAHCELALHTQEAHQHASELQACAQTIAQSEAAVAQLQSKLDSCSMSDTTLQV